MGDKLKLVHLLTANVCWKIRRNGANMGSGNNTIKQREVFKKYSVKPHILK